MHFERSGENLQILKEHCLFAHAFVSHMIFKIERLNFELC